MVLLLEKVREIFNSPRKKTFFSRVCMNVLHHVDKNAMSSMRVQKFGWRSTSITSLFALLWSICLPSSMTSSNNLPNNSELKCEQSHEYFLNRFHFATWKSCELSLFVKVSELFLLLSPGSSTTRLIIPATDLPVGGLASMGSNILSNAASPCDRTHDSSGMPCVPSPCVKHVLFQFGIHVWVEYNT